MSSLILHVKDRPLAEVQLSKIFYKVLILAQKHKIIIEPNFTTLVRVSLLLAKTNLACLIHCHPHPFRWLARSSWKALAGN